MKAIILLIGLFFYLFTNAQGIITVSNDGGLPADYQSLQLAIDEAAEGSILLVTGTGASYGNIVIDKQLAIYGTGYFLGTNEEPWTQARAASAVVGFVTFDPGSAGSYLAGFTTTSNVSIKASNITLKNNKIPTFGTPGFTPTGILIEGNYLGVFNSIWGENWALGNGGSCTYRNNIILSSVATFSFSGSATSGASIVENNTILSNNTSGNTINVPNGIFRNNLCINTNGASFSIGNVNIVNNNVATGENSFDGYANNLADVTPEETFIDWANPSLYSTDYIYTLAEDSPAIGYGSEGQDVGAFGGDTPYRLSGIPEIPHIYYLEIPTAGTASEGVQMHIKARANN